MLGGSILVVCRFGCWPLEPHQARTDIAARGLPRPVPFPAQLAAAAGVPVVLDAGGATDPLSPGLLRCLAVISPNETELQGLTGGV
jgi:ribokinase